MSFRAATVIKAIGDPRLELVDGKGYWYFVFDSAGVYDTHSVFVMRLNQMPLERWVEEGKDFLAEVTSKKGVSK